MRESSNQILEKVGSISGRIQSLERSEGYCLVIPFFEVITGHECYTGLIH
jgi:hypothetical protein